MTYKDLKKAVLKQSRKNKHKAHFEESLNFAHFKTFFGLMEAPQYAILQGKNNEEFGTTEDMWYLTYTKDGQMIVLDIADEATICDEFLQLLNIWFQGCTEVKTQPVNSEM